MLLPDCDCPLCPRLKEFRDNNRIKFPDKFNAPVPPFGPENAQLLVTGLAPGLKGANFTGRPFTGDYAGVLLYGTLLKFGFATGEFDPQKFYDGGRDSLQLHNCRITNAVRCVPPENKPTPMEMQTCQQFLISELEDLKNIKVILTLGLVSHISTLRTLGERPSQFKFAHGAVHETKRGIKVVNSYHCSRYNTQTNRLTEAMFHQVFDKIKTLLN